MRLLVLALSALVASCSSARTHTLVLLKTGLREGLSDEEVQTAMAGHFANMGALAEEGRLLLAGPFVEPKSDADLRGLFLMATPYPSEAQEWAASDPAVQAGIFVVEADTWWSDDPVEQINVLEKEREARRLADPEIPDNWSGRPYVIAVGWPLGGARKELAALGDTVVLSGTLSKDGQWAWLDVASLDEAQALLPDGEVTWTWHPWYGSKTLPDLGSDR